MSISHSILGRVLAVGLLAGWSVSSLAAVIVTSGTATLHASAVGSFFGLGNVGDVSGSQTKTMAYPGDTTATAFYSTYAALPPNKQTGGQLTDADASGKATLNVDVEPNGLNLSGKISAGSGVLFNVGGGTGQSDLSSVTYFTVTNQSATLDFTRTLSGYYSTVKIDLEKDGIDYISPISNSSAFTLSTVTLVPGDYQLTFSINAMPPDPSGSGVNAFGYSASSTFNLTVIPEISSMLMMGCAFVVGGILLIGKRWHARSY